MTLTLDDFGHGTLTMDGVAASGRRPLLTILVRYFNGTVDLPNPIQFYKDLLWANPFGSTPDGPITYVPNVEHYYSAMSCGRFTWIDAGTVGPVDLSADDGMDDDGRRTRIVQIVKARGLFDFTNYNVPGEPRDSPKRDINVIIFDNTSGGGGQSSQWISGNPGTPSLTLAAHELMHEIGTPEDLYGYDYGFNSRFSLMAATAGGNGDRSAWHADPWHKMRFGWIEPQIEELKPLAMPIRLVAPGVPDATGARILYSPSRGSSEYFILEFRNPSQAASLQDLASYDTGVGGAGLAIWHIILQSDGRPSHFPGPYPNDPGRDWIGVYLDSDPAGKFTSRPGQNYTDFQAGGTTLWAGSTVTPALRWFDGSSTGVRIAVADFAPDADVLDIRIFDASDDINATRFWYSASSSQNLTVSSYGVAGNLELLLSVDGQLQHYWRESEPELGGTGTITVRSAATPPRRRWHGPILAAPPALPGAGDHSRGIVGTKPLAASLIQSRFGKPGNLEAIVRMSGTLAGDWLAHTVRGPGGWSSPAPILVNGSRIQGVTGDPALLQSAFGTTGNFEIVVPAGKRLLHFFRDNDTPGYPWHGPFVIDDYSLAAPSGLGPQRAPVTPVAVSLVQTSTGELEVIVLLDLDLGGNRLSMFKRGQMGWAETNIATDKGVIRDLTGNPALLQSNFGQIGNLELIIPGAPGLLHYWRDNDALGRPWYGPVVVLDNSRTGPQGTFRHVAVVQNGVRRTGDLEVVAQITPPSGESFLVALIRTGSKWKASWPLAADGARIKVNAIE